MPVSAKSAHMAELGRKGARARQVAAIERRIRELTEAVPPGLTVEQRDRLALLLRGAGA